MKSEGRSYNSKLRTFWEYGGELLLAALLTFLLFLLFGGEAIHKNVCNLRGDLLVAVEVLLGLSAAIWVGLLAILATSFGRWLRRKKEAYAYAVALAVPAFIYLLVLLMVLFTACSQSRALTILNVFTLSYGLINFATMIRNVNGLIGLWQFWEARPRSRG